MFDKRCSEKADVVSVASRRPSVTSSRRRQSVSHPTISNFVSPSVRPSVSQLTHTHKSWTLLTMDCIISRTQVRQALLCEGRRQCDDKTIVYDISNDDAGIFGHVLLADTV